ARMSLPDLLQSSSVSCSSLVSFFGNNCQLPQRCPVSNRCGSSLISLARVTGQQPFRAHSSARQCLRRTSEKRQLCLPGPTHAGQADRTLEVRTGFALRLSESACSGSFSSE